MKWTVLVLLLVAACSDGDDEKEAATIPSTTATTSTTPSSEPACFTFEEVDSGASVTVLAVLDCDGDALTLDGEPAAFPVGGTVTHAEGMRCEDDRLVLLSAVSDDGVTYQTVDRAYEVDAGALVFTGETAATKQAAEVQDYYRLDCS